MNSYHAMELLADERVKERRAEADLEWLRAEARDSHDSHVGRRQRLADGFQALHSRRVDHEAWPARISAAFALAICHTLQDAELRRLKRRTDCLRFAAADRENNAL